MRKFEISAAMLSCFAMFKQHGLKIALVQILLFSAIAGLFLFLFADFIALFSSATLANPDMLLGELSNMIGNVIIAIIIASALPIAGYFMGWRIALSRGNENFFGALLYGIIVALPALFAFIIFYIALIVALLLVGVILGALVGSSLSMDSMTMESAGAGIGIGLVLFYVGLITFLLFLAARLGTTGPIMAAERSFNPFSALAASWRLTRKKSLMIMVYLFLVAVGFSLVQIILGYLISLAAAASLVFAIILGGLCFVALTTLYILVPAGIYDVLINKNEDIEGVFD